MKLKFIPSEPRPQNMDTPVKLISQWDEMELEFKSSVRYLNPYTDVDFWVEFTDPAGTKLIRPGFWDHENTWKVRFSSPIASGVWKWDSFSTNKADVGLNAKSGRLKSKSYSGSNPLIAHGLLRMSPAKRNVVHVDGSPFLMIADTPWALPWRGTAESVTEYARNRQRLGFNSALLMSLQPDTEAVGSRNRTENEAFDVAFEDLKEGHINQLNPLYFQYFDYLRDILIDHYIVPVFQPVFHGFGWKGKRPLGWDMNALEYARYCRYLVARYGAKPAMWLVGADSDGKNAGIKEGGEEIEKWDAYRQPAGLHYSPFDESDPDWWNKQKKYIRHHNKTFQDADWLDFQWCQTGHAGKHELHKVALMYNNKPTKAVANAEPTYEGIREQSNAAGWWQGHEAWSQFLSGGTMGVAYGAGSLWNWKLSKDETGWPDWANSNISWKEAIDLPGAKYVGYLGKALEGLDITDIEKHPELASGNLCLAKPDKLFIVYLPQGGKTIIDRLPLSGTINWFDPLTGQFGKKEELKQGKSEFVAREGKPMVIILKNK
jgi:hypothetical protein